MKRKISFISTDVTLGLDERNNASSSVYEAKTILSILLEKGSVWRTQYEVSGMETKARSEAVVAVTAPLEEGTEYTTLHISEPVPTSISIFWSPDTPTGDLLEEALFALSDYLTEIINQDQALKSLYAGQSPLQP